MIIKKSPADIEKMAAAGAIHADTMKHVAGLIRDITVPRSAVVSATVEADGLRAVSGLRAPGLALPGRRKVGTWRGVGSSPRRTAVSATRGEPAVRIVLEDHRWDELIVGTSEAAGIASALSQPVAG